MYYFVFFHFLCWASHCPPILPLSFQLALILKSVWRYLNFLCGILFYLEEHPFFEIRQLISNSILVFVSAIIMRPVDVNKYHIQFPSSTLSVKMVRISSSFSVSNCVSLVSVRARRCIRGSAYPCQPSNHLFIHSPRDVLGPQNSLLSWTEP